MIEWNNWTNVLRILEIIKISYEHNTILSSFCLGDPQMHCAGNLAVHYASNSANEIDCNSEGVPEIKRCRKKTKCSGEIIIKNCISDKTSNVSDMLISFLESFFLPNETKPLITVDNVSHLIFRNNGEPRNKGNVTLVKIIITFLCLFFDINHF